MAWSGVAAAPIAVILLLRLAQVSGGDVGTPVATVLASTGVVVALIGVLLASRSCRDPAGTGRALCLTAAGFVLAAAGGTGSPGHSAFAALALFLEITLLSSPAWMVGARELADRRCRWIAALALAGAGALPIGFGTTALMLELSAAAATGTAGLFLLGGLGLAAAGAAVMAGLAVRQVLAGSGAATPPGPVPVRWEAIPALAVSMVAAVVPGLAADTVISALAPGVGSASVDAGAVLGAGGAWAGGYLGLASLIVVAAVASASVLAGARAPQWEPAVPGEPRPPRRRLWRLLRRGLTARRSVRSSVEWLDTRLVAQPQLLIVVAAMVVAVLLFR
jgi:hypothetical protein